MTHHLKTVIGGITVANVIQNTKNLPKGTGQVRLKFQQGVGTIEQIKIVTTDMINATNMMIEETVTALAGAAVTAETATTDKKGTTIVRRNTTESKTTPTSNRSKRISSPS